jgi:hypothetical protein
VLCQILGATNDFDWLARVKSAASVVGHAETFRASGPPDPYSELAAASDVPAFQSLHLKSYLFKRSAAECVRRRKDHQERYVQFIMCIISYSSAEERQHMGSRKRQATLKLGDRARSKLNRRVGTVDAVDKVDGHRVYGLHYDERPQDQHITTAGHDGARLPPELIERES